MFPRAAQDGRCAAANDDAAALCRKLQDDAPFCVEDSRLSGIERFGQCGAVGEWIAGDGEAEIFTLFVVFRDGALRQP